VAALRRAANFDEIRAAIAELATGLKTAGRFVEVDESGEFALTLSSSVRFLRNKLESIRQALRVSPANGH